jgi:uncharacterized Fe-S cluster protein YjdI
MADEDPGPEPSGKAYAGAGVTVYFDASRCRHFGECVRGLPEVFDTAQRPWIQPSKSDAEAIAAVVQRCPSGALHYRLEDGISEPAVVPTRVRLVPGGPIVIAGDLVLRHGDEEIRETRAALCACGSTANQPFCDGACEAAS